MKLRTKKIISFSIISVFLFIGFLGFLNIGNTYIANAQETTDDGDDGDAGGYVAPTYEADGESIEDSKTSGDTENAIANVVAWIVFYIATFFSYLVSLIIKVMVEVASYNHFLDKEVVINGWSIVRDVANNFFIVILLVIAVGTILRVPNYNRQLLPKLLVMAVLINFSKMFTGIMIDFSQVITLWLAGAIKGASSDGNIILLALGLDKLYRIDAGSYDWTDPLPGGGLTTGAVIKTLLFAMILSIVACVVMAIITIILVYRIVMLWFIVILSPLAFLLTTFPKGQQYAGQWWGELAKYLVVGPIMLFFLYLSFFSGSINVENPDDLSGAGVNLEGITDPLTLQNNVGIKDQLGLSDVENDPLEFLDFLIIIGLMVGSLVFGQKTGVAGAQWASKGVSSLQKWGKKATIGAGTAAAGFAGAQALKAGVAIPGARKVPILGRMAGQAVDKRQLRLASANAKVEQDRITTRSQALKTDGKSEKELREIANRGDKYARIAAVQSMMKQGMFRDDDATNRKENIDLINNARKMLPPELSSTFSENTKKYNPGLAHDTVYKNDKGEFRTDAFVSDVRTGKIKAHEMMTALTPKQIADMSVALGSKGYGHIGDFLRKNVSAKDLTEMNKDMTNSARTEVWKGINKDSWARDTAGNLTEEGKKERNTFNKITGYNNIEQTYDNLKKSEVDDMSKFISSNMSEIGKSMGSISDQLINDFGDVFKISSFKDRGPEVTSKIEAQYQKYLDNMTESTVNAMSSSDKDKYSRTVKNALKAGASFTDDLDDPRNRLRRRVLTGIMRSSNSKDVEEMRNLSKNNSQVKLASENLPIAAIKPLLASADGSIIASKIIKEMETRGATAARGTTERERWEKVKDL